MDKYTQALLTISIPGLLLGAVAIMLVGALWYSRFMFGKSWARHNQLIRTHRPNAAEMRSQYFLACFAALFTSYLLGVVASHATSPHALFFSVLFVWIFVMVEQFNRFIWERAAFALFLINAFRSLAALSAAAFVHYALKLA